MQPAFSRFVAYFLASRRSAKPSTCVCNQSTRSEPDRERTKNRVYYRSVDAVVAEKTYQKHVVTIEDRILAAITRAEPSIINVLQISRCRENLEKMYCNYYKVLQHKVGACQRTRDSKITYQKRSTVTYNKAVDAQISYWICIITIIRYYNVPHIDILLLMTLILKPNILVFIY